MRDIINNHPKKSGTAVGAVEGAVIGFFVAGPPGALAGLGVGAAVGFVVGAAGEHYECAFEGIVGAAVLAAVGTGAGMMIGPIVAKASAAEAAKIAFAKAAEAGLTLAEQNAAATAASEAVLAFAAAVGAAIGGVVGGVVGGVGEAKYENLSLRARLEAVERQNLELHAQRAARAQQLPMRAAAAPPHPVPAPAVAQVARNPEQIARKVRRYTCPITHRIMRDPVLASDHNTYEREAIENLIREARAAGRRPMSPVANAVELTGELPLPPNRLLKEDIDEFIAEHPEFNDAPPAGPRPR